MRARAYTGAKIYGQGFLFDDTDTKGVASPLSEMHRLIKRNPRSQDVIFPYIGGQEVNTSPTHAHHRYVINFREYPLHRRAIDVHEADTMSARNEQNKWEASWADAPDKQRRAWLQRGRVPLDYPEPVAADWPDLLAIAEERVKPERMKLRETPDGLRLKATWWQFGRLRPELHSAITGLERVLVNSQVSSTIQFAFLPPDMVYSHALNVYPLHTYAAFCALQSRPHEVWARFFGSTMKDDLRYTPSDCFETFPFPLDWAGNPTLDVAGQAYYEFRASLMVRNDEGLTKTYNRFHDPYENDPQIATLRELHAAMDHAVLDAYGWTDIPTDCEFLLDYEINEEEWGNRKKPYRYRWPDDVRDEVLARLLELNAERAVGEARASGRGVR